LLVLTWNLYHGRAVPPARRDLLADYAAALAGWEWDVALLQEVPPWWPPELARAARAQQRTALTSRNAGLALRRALARRRPDLMRSNGGGANAILVRGRPILEHRSRRLRRWPERRAVHAVRLEGVWVGNVHAQVHSEERAQADIALAAETVRAWARGVPFVLGGDLNVRTPRAAGLVNAGGHGVDHVLASGFAPTSRAQALDSGALSDHAPVVVDLLEGSVPQPRQETT
jgi:endonuclease/exonuclease/phosphatase family metal-dependent hydrolase